VKKKILRGKKRKKIEERKRRREKMWRESKEMEKFALERSHAKAKKEREKRQAEKAKKKEKERRKEGEARAKKSKEGKRRISQRKSAIVRETGVCKHGHLIFHMTTFGCMVEAVIFMDCDFSC
jgi:hypothetical protein